MHELTESQRETLEFIQKFIGRNHYPPSIREIKLALEVQSSNTIWRRLMILEAMGYIRRTPNKSRAIVLVERGQA